MKIFLIFVFIVGLIYLLWPGPSSVHDLPALPDSQKSTEPGDTYQNPQNTAFFSNHRRQFVTNYYKDAVEGSNFAFLPTLRLNHPPEESWQYIRDQQKTTYLEQFSLPLRDSLFVNGYEPFDENGKPFHAGITNIVIDDKFFDSKTTLRYYHSQPLHRLFIYIGIWVSAIALFKLYKSSLTQV